MLARTTWLIDAMIEALGHVNAQVLMEEIVAYVPPDAHVILSRAGIPDEYVFPLPALLQEKPSLVAYYRLLLGLSQKIFYGSGSGMGRFRSMEAGNLNARQRGITGVLYSDDCRADCDGATDVANDHAT